MLDIYFVDEEHEVFTMKRTVLLTVFALTAAFLSAGDLAVLENLGFSPDGRYFMFGQHVLMADAGQAYAEIAIVDVPRNNFVTGGWKKKSWKIQMLPNQDSRGALYELFGDMIDLKDRYAINHLKQGRMLYTRSGDDESGDTEPPLAFRDFDQGREYILELNQSSQTSGEEVSAAFHIQVTVEESEGITATYTVGRSSYMRPGVASYAIARVWIGPGGNSLVIAVLKESPDLSVRYMVETLVLD